MNRFFKYALTTLCVATSPTAIAADWTPVFKSWENGCNSSSVEDSLLKSLGYDYFDSDAYFKAFDNNGFFKLAGQKNHAKLQKLFTNNAAKQGKYPKVKLPYRNDLGKAVLSRDNEGNIEISIPLSHAKLYNHSIVKYTRYFVPDTGVLGQYITFGAMNNADYQKLKQIKMKKSTGDDLEYRASFNKDSKGTVTLVCDFST